MNAERETARFIPDGAKTRLSRDWFPGEWLEPVRPDIRKPFLERYTVVMGRLMADYLRHQGVLTSSDARQDDDDAIDYGNDFMNLCLIVDQPHTFPVGARNLRTLGYEPDESTVTQAAMALQMEFDEFVDVIRSLPVDTDRPAFTRMVQDRYGYDGDIESEGLLHALAARAAKRLAEDEFVLWTAAETALGSDPVNAVSDRLLAWTSGDHHGDQRGDSTEAAFRTSRDNWIRRVSENRRNTPRSRDEVLRWCHWHTVLRIAWNHERVSEGEEWQRLITRMTIVHRTISRVYARWCDMMPDESDTVQLNLVVRSIASDPDFAESGIVPLCNKIAAGTEPEPDGQTEAMRRVVDYLCVGRRVESKGSTASELIYVGLRKAICGHETYGGRHVDLHGEDYRRYTEMMTGEPASSQDHATVWLFPRMEEQLATMRMRQSYDEDMGRHWQTGRDTEYTDDESLLFHRGADPAVSEWLASETVHTAATDGHGHFLSYRAADPVATYQDINAWRLGRALETYEGARTWGSGSRLAQLYRDRGHLNKQGGRALDRSIRDYALAARGTNDAVQYIAAICGLGAMLRTPQGTETFIKLMDACNGRRDDRFRKSCWTLIRAARTKRMRLTVPTAGGRRISPRLLAVHTADPDERTLVVSELKLVNLVRAFQTVGVDEAKRLLAGDRSIASMIDLAEHYVHDTVTAAVAGLARHDRRWSIIRPMPLTCLGSHMDADGACVFGRTAASTPITNGTHQ